MKDRFPALFARAQVAPRVHRVFGGLAFVCALGLVLALVAVSDGDLGQRFSRALGKGIILVVAASGYFGWALTLRATRDPVWAALVAGKIRRVYPYTYTGASGGLREPRVGVILDDGTKTSVACQTTEQQEAILTEFRAAGTFEVVAAP